MLYNLYYTKHNSRRRRNMTLEDIKDYAAGGVKFDVHFIGVPDGLRYTLEELIGKEEEYVEDIPTRNYGGLFAGLSSSDSVSEDTSGELPEPAGDNTE